MINPQLLEGFFLRKWKGGVENKEAVLGVPTISTSESRDIDRTYMETPTKTEGPAMIQRKGRKKGLLVCTG